MKIKDILTIDLTEDIKNVIDLEDLSDAAIKSEIENYIVTEGLAVEYDKFVSIFTSNILETGVWISGFYGSGKSYFGKLLGYLLSNRLIVGTSARERILQRFTGINNEALIKNSISRLASVNSRVVFLDIAKQDTSKGLSYTLFRNFLKSLALPENEHGFLLFSMICNSGYSSIADYFQNKTGTKWADYRNNRIQYISKIKEIFISEGSSEANYNNNLTTIRREIDQFSASCLKDELSNYFKVNKEEKVVFLFDEASEAISQKKFNLLDLEGLSESLSALGGKVWTVAIAQEKLDDVINNSNISKAQLTKVTDRFKTKIHLEATEVDVIIRNRLLKKKEQAISKLDSNFKANSGKIADHSSLTGGKKTEDSISYSTYYPFYKYQFDLLQNFLFGTKGYASSKVAARGMIITTYDILKLQLQHEELYSAATSWQISKEAQPQPNVRLVNRYDNAERILKNKAYTISGRKLLETINFLSEAEVVSTSLSNIVKAYIKEPDDFHKIKDEIQKALDELIESKILLLTNSTYRITSDIEQRLLDEMNQFTVQPFKKKQQIIIGYKTSQTIKSIARVNDSNTPYEFYITSDNDDELTNPQMKKLKIKLKSLYNFSDNRNSDIEQLKTQFQNDKDTIWIVPENRAFKEIDKLLDQIERIKYLEEKYPNLQSDEGVIVRSLQAERAVKENILKDLIEQSICTGAAIYLYNASRLNKENCSSTITSLQRQIIQNVFDKRLPSQLSDTLALLIIKEANSQKLPSLMHGHGADFQFFDKNGNFIGESLKSAEEILFRTKNTFIDGATLEKELELPPTGYSFGTVISTVAALMRGCKVMAKYNGQEKFSWRDEGVTGIFSAAREFRKASFKAIAKALLAEQKNKIVTALKDLNCEDQIHKKIDWNTNDFELVGAVRELAKHACDKVEFMTKQNKDFHSFFPAASAFSSTLLAFTGAVSEANYIQRAEDFLSNLDNYSAALNGIERVEKFINVNLPKIISWKSFVSGVSDELSKAAKINEALSKLITEFSIALKNDVVKSFAAIQQLAQKIKDEYYALMKEAVKDMAGKYAVLKTDAEALIKEIKGLPATLNSEAQAKAESILQYAQQRTSSEVGIDFDVKDKHTRFTYSEILSFIELYNTKKTEVTILQSGLIRVAPPKPIPGKPDQLVPTKTYTSKVPAGKIKISAYRTWLKEELQKVASAGDNDEIEFKN